VYPNKHLSFYVVLNSSIVPADLNSLLFETGKKSDEASCLPYQELCFVFNAKNGAPSPITTTVIDKTTTLHSLQHSTSFVSAETSTPSKNSTLPSSSTVSHPTPTTLSPSTLPSVPSATHAISSTSYPLPISTPSNSSFVGIFSTTTTPTSFLSTISLDSPSVSSTTSSFSPFSLKLLLSYATLFSPQDFTVIFSKQNLLIVSFLLV
jgi:hypothetical protein